MRHSAAFFGGLTVFHNIFFSEKRSCCCTVGYPNGAQVLSNHGKLECGCAGGTAVVIEIREAEFEVQPADAPHHEMPV